MDTNLAKHRRQIGLTLEDISSALNVNKSTVSRWERGVIAIPLNRLAELELITGLSREALRPDVFGRVS